MHKSLGRRELARKLADYRRIVVSVSGKDAEDVYKRQACGRTVELGERG